MPHYKQRSVDDDRVYFAETQAGCFIDISSRIEETPDGPTQILRFTMERGSADRDHELEVTQIGIYIPPDFGSSVPPEAPTLDQDGGLAGPIYKAMAQLYARAGGDPADLKRNFPHNPISYELADIRLVRASDEPHNQHERWEWSQPYLCPVGSPVRLIHGQTMTYECTIACPNNDPMSVVCFRPCAMLRLDTGEERFIRGPQFLCVIGDTEYPLRPLEQQINGIREYGRYGLTSPTYTFLKVTGAKHHPDWLILATDPEQDLSWWTDRLRDPESSDALQKMAINHLMHEVEHNKDVDESVVQSLTDLLPELTNAEQRTRVITALYTRERFSPEHLSKIAREDPSSKVRGTASWYLARYAEAHHDAKVWDMIPLFDQTDIKLLEFMAEHGDPSTVARVLAHTRAQKGGS